LRHVAALWVATAVVFVLLMAGGILGLEYVPTDAWGGLPLSIFVFIATVLVGFPFAIALALGRGSRLPVFRIVCTAAIEIVRAVPILTILFCAAVVDPADAPGLADAGQGFPHHARHGVLLRMLPGGDHSRRTAGCAAGSGARARRASD
jgi:general L-amino acid transport system permease protein